MFGKWASKLKHRKQFIQITDAVSYLLTRTIIVLLILMILAQVAIQNDTIRHWVTDVERWEGRRLN